MDTDVMLRLNYDCLDEVEGLVDYVNKAMAREDVCAEYKARMMFTEWLVSRFIECAPEGKVMSALSNFKSERFDSEKLIDNAAIVFEESVENYLASKFSKNYLIFPVRLGKQILICNAKVIKIKEEIDFNDMYCFSIILKHTLPKWYKFNVGGIKMQPKRLIFYVMSYKYYFVRFLYLKSLDMGLLCAG